MDAKRIAELRERARLTLDYIDDDEEPELWLFYTDLLSLLDEKAAQLRPRVPDEGEFYDNEDEIKAEDSRLNHQAVRCENAEDEPTYAEPADYCLDGTAPPKPGEEERITELIYIRAAIDDKYGPDSKVPMPYVHRALYDYLNVLILSTKPVSVTREWMRKWAIEFAVESKPYDDVIRAMLREIGVTVKDEDAQP